MSPNEKVILGVGVLNLLVMAMNAWVQSRNYKITRQNDEIARQLSELMTAKKTQV